VTDTVVQVVLFLAIVAVIAVVGIRAGIIVGRRIDARLERAEEDEEPGD
jgi:hypothetical protein